MTNVVRISRLEGSYEHLATRADAESLRATLSQEIGYLNADPSKEIGSVREEVARASLSAIKWIIGAAVGPLAAQARHVDLHPVTLALTHHLTNCPVYPNKTRHPP